MNVRSVRQHGLSIVELMVSMTIGLIVLSLASYAYVANKRSWTFNDQDARLQDRGRYAISVINDDLRLAGYMGCKSIASSTPIPSMPPVIYLNDLLVSGVGVTNSGDATATLSLFGPVPGGNFALKANLAKDAKNFTATALVPDFAALGFAGSNPAHASFVLIDDCASAQFVPATVTAPTSGQDWTFATTTGASAAFAKDTVVTWYDWGGAAGAQGVVYTYVNNKLSRNGQLLVDNVEHFRVCLGIDTNNDDKVDEIKFADWSATGSHGNDRPLVAFVEMVLASPAASEGPLVLDAAAASTFSVCGSPAADGSPSTKTFNSDRRLRRQFSTTVTLRNRVR